MFNKFGYTIYNMPREVSKSNKKFEAKEFHRINFSFDSLN